MVPSIHRILRLPDFLRFFYAQLSAALRSLVKPWLSQVDNAEENVEMTIQSVIHREFPSASSFGFEICWARAKTWFAAFQSARSQRKTDKLLERLDPSVLEDIGVPHYDASPRAGELNRHPRFIAVKSGIFR
jgi:hypothetical protein